MGWPIYPHRLSDLRINREPLNDGNVDVSSCRKVVGLYIPDRCPSAPPCSERQFQVQGERVPK